MMLCSLLCVIQDYDLYLCSLFPFIPPPSQVIVSSKGPVLSDSNIRLMFKMQRLIDGLSVPYNDTSSSDAGSAAANGADSDGGDGDNDGTGKSGNSAYGARHLALKKRRDHGGMKDGDGEDEERVALSDICYRPLPGGPCATESVLQYW